jgi:heme-degrading monooxygenase HmoA
MAYAVILDSPANLDFHRMVNSRLGDEHPGFLARFAGETPDGLRVISVWESKADADRFFAERLAPLVREVTGATTAGPPQISELDVEEYWMA